MRLASRDSKDSVPSKNNNVQGRAIFEVKQDRADLEEKFVRVEKEKNDMYGKFEIAVDQLRNKANVKNSVLDQVLAARQAELERKNVQLRELV